MTICGPLSFTLLERMTSSTRTKSPAALVTTADRMALAPLGTPTKDGASAKSDGTSQASVGHSSTFDLKEMGLRARECDGANALVLPATVARATTEANTFIVCKIYAIVLRRDLGETAICGVIVVWLTSNR